MLQSDLLYKTQKNIPSDETSINAQLLIKGCFIKKEAAGIYSYLPLGLIILNKIENIIREEINKTGAKEILMSALTPKQNWVDSGRWNNFDALFKLEGKTGSSYALGATHEEIVTPIAKQFVNSYKDLPLSIYQIQTKFRNEERAKSGILRGREFRMKDLYSFHTNEADLIKYYEIIKNTYKEIYRRVGLGDTTYPTYASGGAFSKYSEEFQTITDAGEDTIYICNKCKCAINNEIINEQNTCPECGNKDLEKRKAIEVGNIFKLGDRFTKAFDFSFINENGEKKYPLMGCYGIGPSRVMGAVVEVCNDENGIIWPENIAPFKYHIIMIGSGDNVIKETNKLYEKLSKNNEVLLDNRDESAGVKLKDADLIGCPIRIVVSEKTLEKGSVEIKKRNSNDVRLEKINKI